MMSFPEKQKRALALAQVIPNVICLFLLLLSGSALAVDTSPSGALSYGASLPLRLVRGFDAMLPYPSQLSVELQRVLPEHARLLDVEFSPDEGRFVAALVLAGVPEHLMTQVDIWDAARGEIVQTLYLPVGSDTSQGVSSLSWSADGRKLAACTGHSNDDSVAVIWSGTPGHFHESLRLRDHEANCRSLAFAPAGNSLLLAVDRPADSEGNRLVSTDAATGQRQWGLSLAKDFHPEAIAVSARSGLIALGGRQSDRAERLLVVDPVTHAVRQVFTDWPDQAPFRGLDWSPSGGRLLSLLQTDSSGAFTYVERDSNTGELIRRAEGVKAFDAGPGYVVSREGRGIVIAEEGRDRLQLTGLGSGVIKVSNHGDTIALSDDTGIVVLRLGRIWKANNNNFSRADLGLDAPVTYGGDPRPNSPGDDVSLLRGSNGTVAAIIAGVAITVVVIAGTVEYARGGLDGLLHLHGAGGGANGAGTRDCTDKDTKGAPVCPLLVEVPAGKMIMGTPDGKGDDSERPQHTVTFNHMLAVGAYPVTRGEYMACVAAKACLPPGNAEFKQDDTHPVVMVNYKDAMSYIDWLSQKTGKHYRLPSEAEWEYLARGGVATAYPWGNVIGSKNAVCQDCSSKWDNLSTAPVGSFKPNGFGIYDVVGNVWQWTGDCYHPNYQGAPADGARWEGDACVLRPIRGGAWNETSDDSRLSARRGVYPHTRNYDMGFRVVRDLQ